MVNTIFFIIELIGVVAFAVSGAMKAIIKKLDILGVLVLAMFTALGGGLMRDIILGINPPNMFVNKEYYWFELTDILVAVSIFVCVYIRAKKGKKISDVNSNFLLNVTDAVGVAVFCVFGTKIAIEQGFSDKSVLLVFVGVISGVGGGMLRDILAGEIPAILRKYVYALPAFCGVILYILLLKIIPDLLAVIISVSFITAFRTLAIIFKWNLPSIKNLEISDDQKPIKK